LIKSPQQVASEAGPPPPSTITVPVESRVLDQTVVLRGAVAPQQSVEVKAVLAEVSGRPVIGLKGMIPPYREIRAGMKGPDVEQLQEALRDLGYRIGDDDGTFGASTQRAVRLMYEARDYDAPVVAVTATPAPTTSGAPAAPPKPKFEVYVPMSEMVFIRSFPARVTAVKQSLGAEVEGPLLSVSLGGLVVRGGLAAADRQLVETGMAVEILDEATDRKAAGKVAAIASAEKDAEYAITVAGTKALPQEFAGLDVRLTIKAATTGSSVLVVPVSAIFSAADGSTQVLKAGDGTQRQAVAVRVGATSGGFVQIETDELAEGDLVVVGERSP
jgi:hypothetical protein